MKIFSSLRRLLEDNPADQHSPNQFHKNLFQEDKFPHDNEEDSDSDVDDDGGSFTGSDSEYTSDTEQPTKASSSPKIISQPSKKNKSSVHKLKNLPLPLTETIAEVLQEFSHDKFLLDDIAFIFEMSRKRAISPYALVVALIYLNRLKTKTKSKYTSSTSSRASASSVGFDKYAVNYLTNTELCLVSLLLASKYLIDEGEVEEIYNDEWALASELPVKEINKLEKSFLRQMDWDLYVSSEEFWDFTDKLTEKTTRKKIRLQNNQITYTDLDVLLSSKEFSLDMTKKYLDLLAKLFIICSSTIVYVTLSSIFVSAYVYFLKNQLLATTSIFNVHQHQQQQGSIRTNLTADLVRRTQPLNGVQVELDSNLEEEINPECLEFLYSKNQDKKSIEQISQVISLIKSQMNGSMKSDRQYLEQRYNEQIKLKNGHILKRFFL